MSVSQVSQPTEKISMKSLLQLGLIALALSLIINWLITFGAISADIAPQLDALNYGPITFLTTIGVLGATITYGVLTRVVDNPNRVFTILAAILLLISLIPDFTIIPNETGGSLLAGSILALMHITTAVICVGVLTEVRNRIL